MAMIPTAVKLAATCVGMILTHVKLVATYVGMNFIAVKLVAIVHGEEINCEEKVASSDNFG